MMSHDDYHDYRDDHADYHDYRDDHADYHDDHHAGNVVTVCQNDQRFLLLDVMLWQLDRSINTAAQDKHHHITDCW